jgi:hypothetical protein
MKMSNINPKATKVQKSMDETVYVVEVLTNKFNSERQIQINDSYIDKNTDELNYGRRGININIIDIPAVVAAVTELYEKETGKSLDTILVKVEK